MTKLNNTTQKAKRWIAGYYNSSCYSVTDFYGRCSAEKVMAEAMIKEKMKKLDCKGYKVLSGNCFHFVCGYVSDDGKTLYIETMSNTYTIEL